MWLPLPFGCCEQKTVALHCMRNSSISSHLLKTCRTGPTAGCGFLDAIDKLVELGADLNARDITSCTPLQNAAHGTYSALAAMPAGQGGSGSSGSGGGHSAGAITAGHGAANGHAHTVGGGAGTAGAASNSGQQLTVSQQAAQAAMTNSAARAGRPGARPHRPCLGSAG